MRVLIPSLLLPFALTACGLASFDVPVSGIATVEAGVGEELIEVVENREFELPENLKQLRITKSQAYRDSGFSEDDIHSVTLTSVKLRIVDGDPNFDFVETMEVFMEIPGSGLVKVAETATQIPPGSTEVSLRVFDTDLKELALSDNLSVSAKATRRSPVNETQIEVKAVFHVAL